MSNVVDFHDVNDARQFVEVIGKLTTDNGRIKRKDAVRYLETAIMLIAQGRNDAACRFIALTISRLECKR